MNKFSFKYYPPPVLVYIVCIIISLRFGYNVLVNAALKNEFHIKIADVLSIPLLAGFVVGCLSLINRTVMWKGWLRILGLYDIRGTYIGTVTSSYHMEDNPRKPNIKLYCKLIVVQNLNGFEIKGAFYNDKKMAQQSSYFTSSSEGMKKENDGSLRIHYFYSNKGDQLHPDNKKYGLNNHDGVCVLSYDPQTKQMEGYYFNHERASHGKLVLKLSK
ncbi:hypothetical protein [Chitinophaga japonensis]|uniref:Uncharacterized protein n=1 Tax=Chitinophaga japonensis TaxID=104662 RepID=A0A562T2V0_CHIJA|nr:hypothetical protein [Chitinophaga japonensis]TWI87763.1 hypothetical protein LX66_1834 [Chitinophaga japonensis]